MIFKVYSVLDSKAGAFAPPFFLVNDELALRSIAGARLDPNSMMSRFPGDFKVFCIGEFDDELGTLVPASPRLLVETSQPHPVA